MESIAEIINKKPVDQDTRNKYEFQAFGNRLAEELNDPEHRTLYIKLAKEEDRGVLESAREFVLSAENTTTKGRLFMWKLKQLKQGKK